MQALEPATHPNAKTPTNHQPTHPGSAMVRGVLFLPPNRQTSGCAATPKSYSLPMKSVTISLDDKVYENAIAQAAKKRKSVGDFLRDFFSSRLRQELKPADEAGISTLQSIWDVVDSKAVTPGTVGRLNREALYDRGLQTPRLRGDRHLKRARPLPPRTLIRPEAHAILTDFRLSRHHQWAAIHKAMPRVQTGMP